MKAYEPISRDLYEELEMRAAFRQACSLRYRAGNGSLVTESTRIILVKQPEGEFLVTEKGGNVRLDQLVSVDDILLEHWT